MDITIYSIYIYIIVWGCFFRYIWEISAQTNFEDAPPLGQPHLQEPLQLDRLSCQVPFGVGEDLRWGSKGECEVMFQGNIIEAPQVP